MNNVTIIRVAQGSPEWQQHRASHFNASDAPAMLGLSAYQSRSDLVRETATGFVPEVDTVTQRRFDDGHAYEEIARPWAEEIIGEDLYPIVLAGEIDGLPLSASYDGATLLREITFEHKTLNAALAASLDEGVIPEEYHPQLEQQLLLSGAGKCLFMASAGDRETMRYAWYESDPQLRAALLAGWAQFAEDVANYAPRAAESTAVGKAPDALPALLIEVTGQVTACNLDVFQRAAVARFQSISRDLKTDEDFANAEQTAKWCGEIESSLEAAKQHALAQTASIDELFRTIDSIKDEARATRLELDRLVKARKTAIRGEILQEARDNWAAHIVQLNTSLSTDRRVTLNLDIPDFAGAMKGKKTVKSCRDACDDLLAKSKIAANEHAEKLRANLKRLQELAKDHRTLFADWRELIDKDSEAMGAIVKQRIAEHEAAEKARLEAERARIRAEEEAKAKAEAEKREAAERERIRQEEAAKLRAESVTQSTHTPQRATQVTHNQLTQPTTAAPSIDKNEPASTAALGEELQRWREQYRVTDEPYSALLAILYERELLEAA